MTFSHGEILVVFLFKASSSRVALPSLLTSDVGEKPIKCCHDNVVVVGSVTLRMSVAVHGTSVYRLIRKNRRFVLSRPS